MNYYKQYGPTEYFPVDIRGDAGVQPKNNKTYRLFVFLLLYE